MYFIVWCNLHLCIIVKLRRRCLCYFSGICVKMLSLQAQTLLFALWSAVLKYFLFQIDIFEFKGCSNMFLNDISSYLNLIWIVFLCYFYVETFYLCYFYAFYIYASLMVFLQKTAFSLVWSRAGQGCINCAILLSGIGAHGVSSEHMENMEMFSCSPT